MWTSATGVVAEKERGGWMEDEAIDEAPTALFNRLFAFVNLTLNHIQLNQHILHCNKLSVNSFAPPTLAIFNLSLPYYPTNL